MNRVFVAVALLLGPVVGCGESTGHADHDAGTGGVISDGEPTDVSVELSEADAPPKGGEVEAGAGQAAADSSEGEASPAGGSTDAEDAEPVEFKAGAIRLTAPGTWVRKKPRSGFVAAEFQLPAAEGDERDGRLTISMAGGGVEANLNRWRGQFGGKPDNDSQDEVEIDGVTVTVVDFSGTYNDAKGPFAPGVKRPGYRMIGAVIPVEGALHFVKAYGPEKTMDQHAKAFRTFLQTLDVDSP